MSLSHAMTKKELLGELEEARSRVAELEGLVVRQAGIIESFPERKWAEEALRESEERFRQLAENIQEVFWITSPGYEEMIYISPAYEDIWGRSCEELYRKPITWLEVIVDEDRGRVMDFLAKSAEQGLDTEYRILRPDGDIRWIRDRAFAVRDEEGDVVRFVGLAENITDRKRVESALRESEEKFSALSKATFETVFISDEGVCVEANEAASEMFGYSNEEFIGIFGTDVIAPESKEVVKAHMIAGDEKPYEAVAVRKNGSRFPAEFRGKMFHYKGRLIRATSVRDLTERKMAEEAVRESEEKYRAIVENIADVVMRFDLQGRHIYVNPVVERYLPLKPGDFQGKTHHELGFREEQAAFFEDKLREVIETGRPLLTEFELESIIGWIVLDWRLFPEFDDQGKVRGVVTVGRDVTSARRMEDDLRQAKVAAEDANRAKSEFLANMSHELRTPLNGIMGMLQMTESTPLTEKQQEYIESALGASQSLLFIINDILDISKVEAGKLEIVEEEFHLWDILHVVNEVLRQEANRKKVNLHYSINGDVPTLLVGDSARMRQILFNLLGNAVKFTEQGEVHARVDFEPLDGEGDPVKLVFAVSDTGMGIPEEHLQHIFEPFSQVSGGHARRFQGTGLGLAIVKRLVEAMGGEVSVESRLGKGTTFHFHVLVKTTHPSPGERPLEKEQPTDAHPLPALRILLVEDNALNLNVLQGFLEEQGHAAVGAATGREALAAMEKDRFDVVLMDVQLPEMDGVEATRRIRSGQCGVNAPDIPIVALTAYAMQGDRKRFMEAGMDDYLAKPITVKELKEVLVRVAGK